MAKPVLVMSSADINEWLLVPQNNSSDTPCNNSLSYLKVLLIKSILLGLKPFMLSVNVAVWFMTC